MSVSPVARRLAPRPTNDQLFALYRHDGDPRAREQLVERFMPLARKLAVRYSYTHEPIDDLIQVACVGLLKAIDRFEPQRGKKFTSFAAPTILGELKRHFRDKGWAVHVPRDLQEMALAVNREAERLSQRLGRSPTLQELAEAFERPVEELLEASEAAHSYQATSLDAPVARDGEEALADLLGDDDDRFELAESRQAIADSWRSLSELERRVLSLRLVENMTQREIGEHIGYSQMHVSRLLRRSLKRLTDAAESA